MMPLDTEMNENVPARETIVRAGEAGLAAARETAIGLAQVQAREPFTKMITVRLNLDEREAINRAAHAVSMSVNAYCRARLGLEVIPQKREGFHRGPQKEKTA